MLGFVQFRAERASSSSGTNVVKIVKIMKRRLTCSLMPVVSL